MDAIITPMDVVFRFKLTTLITPELYGITHALEDIHLP